MLIAFDVAFVQKEWCFIIWLNMAYYKTEVSVIIKEFLIYKKWSNNIVILYVAIIKNNIPQEVTLGLQAIR